MRVTVVHDFRFRRTPDGAVWTETLYEYKYWTRYLDDFDGVRAVTRVQDVETVPAHWRRMDGDGVEVWGVPYYWGPAQYALRMRGVAASARAALDSRDAVICRAGSQIQVAMEPVLRRAGRPYAMEVPYDPWDLFAPGANSHPLRAFFRRRTAAQLRRQCAGACAAAYVTERALQARYPVRSGALSISYSDIDWIGDAFVAGPRPEEASRSSFTIVTVGTLEALYKAPDALIDAVAECVSGGLDLQLVLIGDGKHRAELEARSRARGIGERVRFLGWLPPGGPVREQLDRADLFILPSRQEGVPRAMIEAMARGLPCVGSTVGGIPEVLHADDLVPPADVPVLTRKISEILTDPRRRAEASARNLARARDFSPEIIRERQRTFFRYVRERTEEWIAGGGVPRRGPVAGVAAASRP